MQCKVKLSAEDNPRGSFCDKQMTKFFSCFLSLFAVTLWVPFGGYLTGAYDSNRWLKSYVALFVATFTIESSWCLVIVVWLFFPKPRVCLQFVIVVFPDHIHLPFLLYKWGS